MHLLRIVTIGSRQGLYGGPYSTALRQVEIANHSGIRARMLYGTLDGDEPDDVESIKVPVRILSARAGYPSAFSLRILVSLVRNIRRIHVIHVSFAREIIPIFASGVAVILRKRLVIQPHGMIESKSSVAFRVMDFVLVRPIARRADIVLALTDIEATSLVDWAGTSLNTQIAGNSIPDDLLAQSGAIESDEVLCMGRIHPRKRIEDFIVAAHHAQMSGAPGRYTVVGPNQDARELDRLEAIASAWGNVVSFEPAVTPSRVYERIARARVVVLPSINEPWGNIVVAATGLGIPVVVNTTAAISRLVEEYRAGLVVEPREPAAIASAVTRLLEDRALYLLMSERARELARSEFTDTALRANYLRAWSLSGH